MAEKTRKPEKEDNSGLQTSVVRVFSILETLSQVKSLNLEHLSQQTGLAKPTVYRFLNSLKDLGYVRRDHNDQYSTTLKLFSIGSRSLDHMDLYEIARPIARNLSLELGETVHVGIRDEHEALYLIKIESKYTIRMYSRVGKRIPLYCTAIGKCLLSGMDNSDLDTYGSVVSLVPFTPGTLTSLEQLKNEIHQIREQGFAEDREEHEEGIRCIGSPIRDYTGSIIAALSVSWPLFRFDKDREENNRKAVQEAAEEISRILGYYT